LKKFRANGKLLLTGEYLVLDGAFALALPCKLGQSLHFSANNNKTINWNSFDYNNDLWFKASFNCENFELIQTSNNESFEWLIKVIKNALKLSKKEKFDAGDINTYLEFPINWGLGSSSTTLSNVAQLFNIDPFDLHFQCSNGSGYDIACAKSDGPITYQIKDNIPTYQSIKWHPDCSEELFFIYLNTKQNSNNEVIRYKQNKKDERRIKEISDITSELIHCNRLNEIEKIITEHEKIIGYCIGENPIKEKYFSGYEGAIKSLGAWGGDFILVTRNQKKYFENKGFKTIISFDEMIKNSTFKIEQSV
tara:strand:- start:17132 stop:18052 length:921 start_codon:yes stop_codon:yes gene_type:complete